MTELLDDVIAARFDAIAYRIDDSDWRDVRRRARPRRLQLALAAAVFVLAAIVTAVAFGWPQTFIDFFDAPPAPQTVKHSFGVQNVIAPRGMNPHAIPDQAKRVMVRRFDATGIHPGKGGWHKLYVAPTRAGGFCWEWTRFTGSCASPTTTKTLSVSWMGNDFPLVATGYVPTGKAKTVEAHFADGAIVDIPVTWVSAPIGAGFFLLDVPPSHRTRAAALSSVVALDDRGHVVGRQSFRLTRTSPLDREVGRTLPDGTRVPTSRRARVATARKVISFTSTSGSHVWLWVMARRGGGRCYVFNQGSGCPAPSAVRRGPAFAGGLSIGTKRVLFFAQAKPAVAAIALRYQDGSVERVTPVEGFVLHEIAPAHYTRGTRLVAAVGFDRQGRAVFRQAFGPEMSGVYPCDKPIARGYGVKTCP
jgi:hypothetical protein